ncbi:1224_t:CDS:2, partial [Funneliformis caledonium]
QIETTKQNLKRRIEVLETPLSPFIDEKQAEILKEIKILVAKQAGNVELNDQVAEINCANPLHGRSPKRYQSGENQKTTKRFKENENINVDDNGNQKKTRKCKRCQETGHDMRNCKVLIEKIEELIRLIIVTV